MVYNSGFPVNYQYLPTTTNQQQQNIQPQPQPQSQSQNTNGIVWVQGENAAKSFLVAPNTSILLMDSEAPVFYIKSADASGIPHALRIFDYQERVIQTEQPVIEDNSKLNELEDKLDKFMARMEALEQSVSTVLPAPAPVKGRKGASHE